MQYLLLNASVNWGQLFEYGLAAAVVAAVFAMVLKPMVNQMLKTNSELSKSFSVLANRDKDLESDIKELKEALARIEQQLRDK